MEMHAPDPPRAEVKDPNKQDSNPTVTLTSTITLNCTWKQMEGSIK